MSLEHFRLFNISKYNILAEWAPFGDLKMLTCFPIIVSNLDQWDMDWLGNDNIKSYLLCGDTVYAYYNIK